MKPIHVNKIMTDVLKYTWILYTSSDLPRFYSGTSTQHLRSHDTQNVLRSINYPSKPKGLYMY